MSAKRRRTYLQLSVDGNDRKKKKNENDDNLLPENVKKPGTINRIVLRNFMCHSHLEMNFTHNINYIIGNNGSGKSAIMTALRVGLGGKAALTSRGYNIKDFIKAGKTSSSIEVTLNNHGTMAYRFQEYGNQITIIRNFDCGGNSNYKIQSSTGEVISTQVKEIHSICSHLNIQIDNPICLLNQNTARNFLNTTDSHQKYLLFIKATRLDELYEKHIEMCDNKRETLRMLEEKKVVQEELRNEMKMLKNKIEDQNSVYTLKSKVKDLQNEMLWAKVRDEELKHQKQLQIVNIRKEELLTLTTEIKNELIDCNKAAIEIRVFLQQILEFRRSVEEQNERQSALVGVLRKLKENLYEKQREIRLVVKDIAIKTGNCKILEDEISSIAKNFEQMEAEREKRLKEILELEKKYKEIEGLLESSQNDLFQLRNAVTRLQEEERTSLFEVRQVDSQIENTNTRLNGLKGNTDILSLYGNDMPLIIKAVQQESNKFDHIPRGPLGSYITLKDKKWAVAVEGFLSPSLLRAFTVDNQKDNELLMKIFDRICTNCQRPMVITSKFFFTVHDVNQYKVAPVDGCISVFDAVEITDPVVANCLMDQVKMESVLLIPDNQTAIKLMSEENDVPKNCQQGLTMKGDEYYPDPNYKTYASRYTEAQYLQVSIGDMVSQLEQKLEDLHVEKESVNNQYQAVKEDFLKQTENAKASEIKVNKFHRALLVLKRKLSDLQNVDEPTVNNFTKIRDELKELRCLVEQRSEVQEKIELDVQELKRKIDVKESKLKRIKRIVRVYESRIEALKAQIRENRWKMTNFESNRRFARNRLRESRQRVNGANCTLSGISEIVQIMTSQASKSGFRPSDIRAVETIVKEIDDNERTINQIESNLEDLDVLMKKYNICRNKNIEVEEFMVNITKDVKLLSSLADSANHNYKNTEDYFITFIKHSFQKVLALGQFQGTLNINVAEKKLDLVVTPQHGSQGDQTTANLSGGERSFSTLAFLCALWECIEMPFYFLDEFDVFMDKVNRSKVMEVLLSHAKNSPESQFVFLTPQGVSVNDQEVAIHRLADPERGSAF